MRSRWPSISADELLSLGAATLGEAGARPMHPRVRAAWHGARLAAPAFTARCAPGDNLAVHVAVAEAPAGSAVVVDASARPEIGYWGEVLTTAAESRGLVGLVIDGAVRDINALESHRFPVFSNGLALPGATKKVGGTVGERVRVGDVDVTPGDWVVGDADGVVVVAAPELAAVLDAGRARVAREQGLFTRLREGATTIDLLGLDPAPVRRAGQGSTPGRHVADAVADALIAGKWREARERFDRRLARELSERRLRQLWEEAVIGRGPVLERLPFAAETIGSNEVHDARLVCERGELTLRVTVDPDGHVVGVLLRR